MHLYLQFHCPIHIKLIFSISKLYRMCILSWWLLTQLTGSTRTWVTFPGSLCHSSEGWWLIKLKGSAWSLCSLMCYELLMLFSCQFMVVIFWQLEHGTQPTFGLHYSLYVYFSSYQFGDDCLRKLEMAPVDVGGTQTQHLNWFTWKIAL